MDVVISPTTGRVGIRFYRPERNAQGQLDYFSVELIDPTLKAQSRVYAWGAEHLIELFEKMAEHWRGWSGPMVWGSVEGELTLSCTTDGRGHIAIKVQVKESAYPDSWEIQATALVEAGQLEGLARSVRGFISGNAA